MHVVNFDEAGPWLRIILFYFINVCDVIDSAYWSVFSDRAVATMRQSLFMKD